MIDLKKVTTENRNDNTKNIDIVSTIEILKLINNEDKTVPLAVEKQLKEISEAVELTYDAIKNNGRVFYIGAGTSGRLGVLDASEMPPTFNVEPTVFIGLIAGGDVALRFPVENAEDDLDQAKLDLEKHNFSNNDVLIGIAASGRTPYVIGGLNFAKQIGAKTISLSTSSDTAISKIADVAIEVVVGAEPITGSTRMKSGTAQKLVLNMISTATMIKMGKVYENLMIDVKASNEKLIQRTINITKELTNSDDIELIKKTLSQCDDSPKIATVAILKNISVAEAKDLLKQNDNILRKVIN